MTSARRIHANRLNAKRSSGPNSAPTKQKVRSNALRHGLSAQVCTPEEELEALRRRKAECVTTFGAGDGLRDWLLDRLAAETLTFERCERHEALLRQHLAGRVGPMWDEDRRAEVLNLAARLAGDPERIADRLRATSHGCDLMIERWEDLAIALEYHGAWDERHRHRAMDLLGLSAEAREDDPLGLATQTVEELVALVAAEIEALEARQAGALDQKDADVRALAARGMFADVPRSLKLVRRYQSESYRRMTWLWSQLREMKAESAPAADASRAGRPGPDRAPAPEAGPAPPPPPKPPEAAPAAGASPRREPAGATPAPPLHRNSGAVRPEVPPRDVPVSPAREQADVDWAHRRSRPDPQALKRRRRR